MMYSLWISAPTENSTHNSYNSCVMLLSMNTSQKGFIAPLILIIIAVLVFGGGAYVYTQTKQVNQSVTATSTAQTVNSQTSDWKTYTNYAFGFSIKLPPNNSVYTCGGDYLSNPQLADEKSYRVFILENPTEIDLIKSCDYPELSSHNRLSIYASQRGPNDYVGLVANWKKSYGDGEYTTISELTVDNHSAILQTKVEIPNNSNQYKEMAIDGGKYLYIVTIDKRSDSLEKILTTFQVIPAKDTFSYWQTLKSSDLGIEIGYPYNYRADSTTTFVTIYPVPQPIEFGPGLGVSRKSVPVGTNIDTYVSNFLQSMSVKERGTTIINGINWLKARYEVSNDVGPGGTNTAYFTIHNGYVYTITYGEAYTIHVDNFEKIVSTVKFTQATSVEQTSPSENKPGPVGIILPATCHVTSQTPNSWMIDCGPTNDARGVFGAIIEKQGWKYCDHGLASAYWWKDGVITTVSESPNENGIPFQIMQGTSTSCFQQ